MKRIPGREEAAGGGGAVAKKALKGKEGDGEGVVAAD